LDFHPVSTTKRIARPKQSHARKENLSLQQPDNIEPRLRTCAVFRRGKRTQVKAMLLSHKKHFSFVFQELRCTHPDIWEVRNSMTLTAQELAQMVDIVKASVFLMRNRTSINR
jgi:hypothetical protein